MLRAQVAENHHIFYGLSPNLRRALHERLLNANVGFNTLLQTTPIPMDWPEDYFLTDVKRLGIYTKWKVMFRMTKRS